VDLGLVGESLFAAMWAPRATRGKGGGGTRRGHDGSRNAVADGFS